MLALISQMIIFILELLRQQEAVVLGLPGIAISTHYLDSLNLEFKVGLVLEELIASKNI